MAKLQETMSVKVLIIAQNLKRKTRPKRIKTATLYKVGRRHRGVNNPSVSVVFGADILNAKIDHKRLFRSVPAYTGEDDNPVTVTVTEAITE